MEQYIKTHLDNYLDNNDIIHKHHHGSRKGHGTDTATGQIQHELLIRYEDNKMTTTIQTDLRAAFDTIDATALTDKLQYYGVTGQELKLFKSFLTDRRQYVQIDTFTSTIEDSLPCSVVQGSKLSVTLYTLYTNEITLLYKLMGTEDYELITGQKQTEHNDMDHIIINYVDDSTNIISSDNKDQLQLYIDKY